MLSELQLRRASQPLPVAPITTASLFSAPRSPPPPTLTSRECLLAWCGSAASALGTCAQTAVETLDVHSDPAAGHAGAETAQSARAFTQRASVGSLPTLARGQRQRRGGARRRPARRQAGRWAAPRRRHRTARRYRQRQWSSAPHGRMLRGAASGPSPGRALPCPIQNFRQ